jgi:hypothetical protein
MLQMIMAKEDIGNMSLHLIRKESTTTPVRAVYNCSASYGPNDPSLNSCLYAGPPQMPEMVGMIIRFRCHFYVVLADVAKAFMQLILAEEDRDVFRFLIPIDAEKEITWNNVKEARYTRPLFGAACSPVLLELVIRHLLKKHPNLLAQSNNSQSYIQ